MDITKKCTRCGDVLPMDTAFFYRARRELSGLHMWCKPCVQDRKAHPAGRVPVWPPYARWAVFEVLS